MGAEGSPIRQRNTFTPLHAALADLAEAVVYSGTLISGALEHCPRGRWSSDFVLIKRVPVLQVASLACGSPSASNYCGINTRCSL